MNRLSRFSWFHGLFLLAVSSARADGAPDFVSVVKSWLTPGVPLLIFGETHNVPDSQKDLLRLLNMLPALRPKMDCLLLELQRDRFQASIDRYMKGEASYADSFEKEMNRFLGALRDDRGNRSHATQAALDKAKALHYKVFAIDRDSEIPPSDFFRTMAQNREDIQFVFYHDHYYRDKFMAQAIADLFKQKKCTDAVLIIGALHVNVRAKKLLDFKGVEVKPLPEQLEVQGIKSEAIRISSIPYETLYQEAPGFRTLDAEAFIGFIETNPNGANLSRPKRFEKKD